MGETVVKAVMQLLDELSQLYEEKQVIPFPYDDCQRLRDEDRGRYDYLVADLDVFFSDIAGYCSWGKGILGWSEEKLHEVKRVSGMSFFEKHPTYMPLKRLVTPDSVPQLNARLIQYERMRSKLLEILSALQPEASGS